jgi:IS1 family transposase
MAEKDQFMGNYLQTVERDHGECRHWREGYRSRERKRKKR